MNRRRGLRLLAVTGLCVQILAACAPRLAPPGSPITDPLMTSQRFITSDGAMLPFHAWYPEGTEIHAIILALHGFNDYAAFFDAPGRFLAKRGIASYAYDQRGFGNGPRRGYWAGVQAYVDDIREVATLLRRRHPGLPLYLLGESMGGAVILAAMTDPVTPDVDGVILAAPAIWARETMNLPLRTLLWVAAHTVPGLKATGRGLKIKPSDNIEMLRALGKDPLVIKKTRIDALWGLTNLMDAAYAAAPRFDAPALILYGDNDELIPWEPTREFLDHRTEEARRVQRVALYAQGWHMLLRDLRAEVVWQDIAAWIDEPGAPLPSGADRGTAGKHRIGD